MPSDLRLRAGRPELRRQPALDLALLDCLADAGHQCRTGGRTQRGQPQLAGQALADVTGDPTDALARPPAHAGEEPVAGLVARTARGTRGIVAAPPHLVPQLVTGSARTLAEPVPETRGRATAGLVRLRLGLRSGRGDRVDQLAPHVPPLAIRAADEALAELLPGLLPGPPGIVAHLARGRPQGPLGTAQGRPDRTVVHRQDGLELADGERHSTSPP
ncbi:hypothetical protein [Streptomyces spiralis]